MKNFARENIDELLEIVKFISFSPIKILRHIEIVWNNAELEHNLAVYLNHGW